MVRCYKVTVVKKKKESNGRGGETHKEGSEAFFVNMYENKKKKEYKKIGMV